MEEQSDTPRTDAAKDQMVRVPMKFINKIERERDEARAEVERLRSALGFYSQPVRYDGPNQRSIPGDPYTAADSAYMNDVCRDGGEIARAALAATEAKP